MRQRREAKAARKLGFSATVSARALKSGVPESSCFQLGSSPQRAGSITASPGALPALRIAIF
ncbi:hypothetical protein VH13_02940 [Corynebacterium ulcerans]|nr:hypothetical protein VH13_02940 [Corynebacterium ulcerans]KKO88071.1 hypothetical protein VH15_01650 [Corynebacterium ulcerans]